MSNELKTKSVAITDINSLKKALAKVKAKGHNVELVENGTCRLYGGQTKKCAYVIKLHDKDFDVGLEASKDNPKEYELCFDDWAGHVYDVLGKPVEGVTHGHGHVRSTNPKHTSEQLTLSNVNALLTDYYTETMKRVSQSHGYTITVNPDKNNQRVMEVAI